MNFTLRFTVRLFEMYSFFTFDTWETRAFLRWQRWNLVGDVTPHATDRARVTQNVAIRANARFMNFTLHFLVTCLEFAVV